MGDYSELKRLADRVISDRRFCGDENHKALADGVMALIAEIEFLTESRQEAREERNKIGDRHDALEAERDQLKAENEALRKVASDTSLELRKVSSWICRKVEAGTESATHWAIRLRKSADLIDAAMGKGEQA